MKKILILLSSFILIPLTSCGPRGVKNDVVILFTNDTHGMINKNLSFATASQMKKELISKGENVLLFDSGDIISGGFYTIYDDGKSMIDFMNEAGYDAATLGNHEFDYDFSYLDELIKHANFPFISTNFYHMKNDKPTTRYTDLGSKIFKLNNYIKVGVIGISTPESISTSTPSHFQDDKGNYIYTFLDKNNDLYDKAQEEIDSIRDKCDYVVCLSHLGDEEQTGKFTASKLASNTSGIDVILDGHTHFSVPGKTVKDKNNKDVFITQAGGTFSHIGKLTIKHDGSIHNELISQYSKVDISLKQKEVKLVTELDEALSTKIAHSDVEFSKLDSKREFNLGDLTAEAPYYYYNEYLPSIGENTSCDLTVVNIGGIRLDNIPKGDWTFKTCKQTHPFGNGVCLIKITGEWLRKALECSCYNLPDYFGGLQQVCGVRMTVDTKIKSDIVFDENKNYVSGPTKNFRLGNTIEIYDRTNNKYTPLEDSKIYKVAGSSYVLLNGGDGLSMFKKYGTLIRQESPLVDSSDLALYISKFAKDETGYPLINSKNSPLNKYTNLGINYTDPGYSQRIVTQ